MPCIDNLILIQFIPVEMKTIDIYHNNSVDLFGIFDIIEFSMPSYVSWFFVQSIRQTII